MPRTSSGAMGGGSEGRELHERFPAARTAAASSDAVSPFHLLKPEGNSKCS